MSETGQKLIAEIRQVAAERPNAIAGIGGCVYLTSDGAPSCLVGHALVNLDLIGDGVPDVWDWNSEDFGYVYDKALGLEIDGGEVAWIQAAQTAQDDAFPWSEAVAKADRNVEVPA